MKSENAGADTLPQLGLVLLLFLSIFWGTNWPMMKIGLKEIPVWTFRTLCLLLGGSGVLCLAKANGLRLVIPRSERWPLILVSLFNVTGWHLCSAYGLISMDAGRAVIIGYTMPVWASILSLFILGERLTLARLIGLLLGIAGLLILVGPDLNALGSAPLGALFMLGAAVTWAGGTVLLKYFRWTMPITVLTGWQLILGGIPVVIGAFILEPMSVLLHVSWRAALVTAYVILIGNILCFWAWIKVVNLFPASLASIGTLAIPVIGVLSSAAVLGEPVGVGEVAALILVVMALSVVLIRPKGS
ncbi:MAG TPA: DMT family transporter [Thermodesulfobacteriota bacterium]|nr:DMT family transporter [Thermodesulfobacteriota bacterium]